MILETKLEYAMDSTTLDECISRMYPDTCGMPEDAKIWSILFDGVLAGITSGLGIIFNIASLVVLFDPPSINLFDQLLISLAFCDVTFLCKPLLITIESKIFRSKSTLCLGSYLKKCIN